jgi:hypothetical protein
MPLRTEDTRGSNAGERRRTTSRGFDDGTDPIAAAIDLRHAMAEVEDSVAGLPRLALNARIAARARSDVAGLDQVAIELGLFSGDVRDVLRDVDGAVRRLVDQAARVLLAQANERRAPTEGSAAGEVARAFGERTRERRICLARQHVDTVKRIDATRPLRRRGLAVATAASVLTAGSHDAAVEAVVLDVVRSVRELNAALETFEATAHGRR